MHGKHGILLFFRSAQEITIIQYNKSKLFSASLNRNFLTDFLTRLLLCSAIRVNSIALAYRNNSQIF